MKNELSESESLFENEYDFTNTSLKNMVEFDKTFSVIKDFDPIESFLEFSELNKIKVLNNMNSSVYNNIYPYSLYRDIEFISLYNDIYPSISFNMYSSLLKNINSYVFEDTDSDESKNIDSDESKDIDSIYYLPSNLLEDSFEIIKLSGIKRKRV